MQEDHSKVNDKHEASGDWRQLLRVKVGGPVGFPFASYVFVAKIPGLSPALLASGNETGAGGIGPPIQGLGIWGPWSTGRCPGLS